MGRAVRGYERPSKHAKLDHIYEEVTVIRRELRAMRDYIKMFREEAILHGRVVSTTDGESDSPEREH